jgi:hypothetical protein
MRVVIAAVVAVMISAAMADELEDAHRLAVSGRDSCWKCLAREYSSDSNKRLSGKDFATHLTSVCATEAEFSGCADGLPFDAISRHWWRSTSDDGQQRHRAGPKGYRDGFHQAQGCVEVAPRCDVPALFLGQDFPWYHLAGGGWGFGMESEKVGGILGAIVAAVVLAIAFAYGPMGPFGKPAKQLQKIEAPKAPPGPPPVKGPVIREVPQ